MKYAVDSQPLRPARRPAITTKWLANDEEVAIEGMNLTLRFVYYGTGDTQLASPALVDPYLPTGDAPAQLDEAPAVDELPEYRYLTEEQRFSYLGWLIHGRRDPLCPEGYVLLFVLGLEQRILVDCLTGDAKDELPVLLDELTGLRKQYGHFSLSSNIEALLEYAYSAGKGGVSPELLDELTSDNVARIGRTEALRRLKHHALAGKAVAGLLGYALLRSLYPPVKGSVAYSNESLFRKQFLRHFDQRYPAGIRLSVDDSAREATYTPLSADLLSFVEALPSSVNGQALAEWTQELLWLAQRVSLELATFVKATTDLAREPHLLSLSLLDAFSPEDPDTPEPAVVRTIRDLATELASAPMTLSVPELALRFGHRGELPTSAMAFLGNALQHHGVRTHPRLEALEHPGDAVILYVAGQRPATGMLEELSEDDLEQITFLASALCKKIAPSSEERAMLHKFLEQAMGGRIGLRENLLNAIDEGTFGDDSVAWAIALQSFVQLDVDQRAHITRFLVSLVHADSAPTGYQQALLGGLYPYLGIAGSRAQSDLSAWGERTTQHTASFSHYLDELGDAVFVTQTSGQDAATASRQDGGNTRNIERTVARPASLREAINARTLPETEWPIATRVFMRALLTLSDSVGHHSLNLTAGELWARLGCSSAAARETKLVLVEALIEQGLALTPDTRWIDVIPDRLELTLYRGEAKGAPLFMRTSLDSLQAIVVFLGQLTAGPDPRPDEYLAMDTFFTEEGLCSPARLRELKDSASAIARFQSRATIARKLSKLVPEQRQRLAAFFFHFSHTAGDPSLPQIKALEKLYVVLGYASRHLYRDLHARATAAGADEFSFSELPPDVQGHGAKSNVKVETSTDGHPANPAYVPGTGHAQDAEIPDSIAAKKPEKQVQRARSLDNEKLKARRAETQEVQAMLAQEFGEYEAVRASQSLVPNPSRQGLLGLDAGHAQFARQLLTRVYWSREEAASLASGLGLRLDGALEMVNEAAFNLLDEALFEGEDPIELNPDTVEKLKNGNND